MSVAILLKPPLIYLPFLWGDRYNMTSMGSVCLSLTSCSRSSETNATNSEFSAWAKEGKAAS
ncbi:MAG: hypothetical protein ACYTXA_29980 [Nostoc sp.]